jgi:predicted nucleotide-binding protein
MERLKVLISEGNNLLTEMINNEGDLLRGDIITRVRSLHLKGRFILRKVDKAIYQEYSNLFSSTFSKEYNWQTWNYYLRTELEKCIGVFRAISEMQTDEIIDKSLRKVFISHGKFTNAFTKLETFIRSLGLVPLYDTNSPSEAKSINTHVNTLISESDFFIILATIETKDKTGKNLPNHNVIIEYDRLMRSECKNVVVLLEKDCKMPSMLQDIIYESFTQESLDNAFIKIASELYKNKMIY